MRATEAPDYRPELKALTVRQPWATLIITGLKTREYRGWRTPHRGPIAIHAGAQPDAAGYEWLNRPEQRATRAALRAMGYRGRDDLAAGVILGTAELVAVEPAESDYGQWAWVLAAPHEWIDQPHARGQLQLWDAWAGIRAAAHWQAERRRRGIHA